MNANQLPRYFKLSDYMDAKTLLDAIALAEENELDYKVKCNGSLERVLSIRLGDTWEEAKVSINFPYAYEQADNWCMDGQHITIDEEYSIEPDYTDIINIACIGLVNDYNAEYVYYSRETEMLSFTCPACQWPDIWDYLESL